MNRDQRTRETGVSRRDFLQRLSASGLAGSASLLSGCVIEEERSGGKGWLPAQYTNAGAWPAEARGRIAIDPENVALCRDDRNCVLCGQCIEVCRSTQSVFGHFELPIIDHTVCIDCGQCAMWCPTAAIQERSQVAAVEAAIADPEKFVVVQTAPGTRVSLGEAFGMEPGTWMRGQQVAALRKLGCDRVFDTPFSADLTIIEEAAELMQRLTADPMKKGSLPQFTSCCPGWVRFCEYFYPELIGHLSTAKSPQQMLGALIKTYYAETYGMAPESIVSVAIMPCTAKKAEACRPEHVSAAAYWNQPQLRDVDFVLTTRELAGWLKAHRINLPRLPSSDYDTLLASSSGAGMAFGRTGGVLQAAVRSVYHSLTGERCPEGLPALKPRRGKPGIREAAVAIPGFGSVRVAAVDGLRNARFVADAALRGECDYHLVEIMACEGGCVMGGGQPRTTVPPSEDVRRRRIAALNANAADSYRDSHENPEVAELYGTFLGYPLSELSHQLLHTHYTSRAQSLTRKLNDAPVLAKGGTHELTNT